MTLGTEHFMLQMRRMGCALTGPECLDFTAFVCEYPEAWIVARYQDRR